MRIYEDHSEQGIPAHQHVNMNTGHVLHTNYRDPHHGHEMLVHGDRHLKVDDFSINHAPSFLRKFAGLTGAAAPQSPAPGGAHPIDPNTAPQHNSFFQRAAAVLSRDTQQSPGGIDPHRAVESSGLMAGSLGPYSVPNGEQTHVEQPPGNGAQPANDSDKTGKKWWKFKKHTEKQRTNDKPFQHHYIRK